MFLFRRTPSSSSPYDALIAQLDAESTSYYTFRLNKSEVGQRVLGLRPEEQRAFVVAAVAWLTKQRTAHQIYSHWPVRSTVLALLRRRLPFTHDELLSLLSWAIAQPYNGARGEGVLLTTLEHYLTNQPLSPELQTKLTALTALLDSGYSTAESRKWSARFKELAGLSLERLPLVAGDVWADAALAAINGMDSVQQTAWNNLLNACLKASAGTPSRKWLNSVVPAYQVIGDPAFKQAILAWLPLVDRPRTTPIDLDEVWRTNSPYIMQEINVDLLRGLVWLSARHDDKQIARAVAEAALSAYRRIPGIGARCVRLGNACVWALGAMPGTEGIAQLARLKAKVKFGTAQSGIAKALTTAAQRVGLSAADLEEVVVPTYGLQAVGQRREQLNDWTFELTVRGTSAVEVQWMTADGKRHAAAPRSLKQQHKEFVDELTATAKDLRKMLTVQRDRIEQLYLERKTWELAAWRERYLDHPLIGTIARRLIWQFHLGEQVVAGIWYGGQIVGRNGSPLSGLDDSTLVELWHPLHASTETVLAWRNWLAEREIQQPFKQAYREIYLLTDAEQTTRVYSNRFAAHLLKQHQFNALCAARGWKNSLRLMVDDCYPPATRSLAAWGLRAEFWVEGIGDNYGMDTNAAGTYLHVTTDQVRFYPLHADEHTAHAGGGGYLRHWGQQPGTPLELEQIPPLVFSEIMRDVDLFVGVASVGNDPNWMDGGNNTRHREYWASYSFGGLSETAKTRRQVLEQLLPRLKIADRCRLVDRFLVVRGDLRTYKIHLGSGNILMEPNDQYLCIVPSRGAAEDGRGNRVFLPFEGDAMLAIILSKAMLLARDTHITDQTIVRQIRG